MKIRRIFALAVLYFFVLLGALSAYHLRDVGVSEQERAYREMLQLTQKYYIEPVPLRQILANSLKGLADTIGIEEVRVKEDDELVVEYNGSLTLTLDESMDPGRSASEFMQSFDLLASTYGDQEDRIAFLDLAFHEAIGPLDPHSSFFTEQEYQDLIGETEGHFGGVGIEVTIRDDLLTVISPLEGTPAHRAGIRAGDRIMKIDGRSTVGMSLMAAVRLIRGEIGTPVVLSVRRDGAEKLLDYPVVRDRVEVKAVDWRMLPERIGYIRLHVFNEKTGVELEAALARMESTPGGLRGIVLDLRNNPGGLLPQAIRAADAFIDEGLIVYTEGREDSQLRKYYAHSKNSRTKIPMVCLVNNGSASASEIVAGALKDHRRALILGTATWGKGSVQSIYQLSGGEALRMTTALYYTPNGTSIQALGIVPHVEFVYRLEDGSEYLPFTERDLTGHLTNDSPARKESPILTLEALKTFDHYGEPDTPDGEAPAEAADDYQILLAADILRLATDPDPDRMVQSASRLLDPMK